MKTVVNLLLLLLSCTVSFAAPKYEAWWQQANKHYELKNYDSAAYYYEQVAALKPADAVVYYNLGNAYYKLNQVGPAVLNYERALALQPGYKEAQDNLSLAQSRIINRIATTQDIFFVKWWKSWTSGSNATTWAVISLLLFIALIGYAIARRMHFISFRLPIQATGIGWAICTCCIILAFIAAANRADGSKAVVMQNDTPLYTTPSPAKSTASVPEGTTVHCSKEQQGWIEVTLPDGRTGWMRTDGLSKI
jgi:hypothetical protein